MNNYRILIADDEAIECAALELLLKNTFTDIQILSSVSNGVEFVYSVKQNHPDIVIVDINMPGLNGLDAIDMIRTQNPHMKVIIHSAYSEFTYAKKAVSLNACEYFVKPIQKTAFIQTMKKIFESLDREREKEVSEETLCQLTGELNRLIENDMISSILLGIIDERTEELFLRSLPHEYHGGFLVTVRLIDDVITPETQKEILRRLGQICLCIGKAYRQDFILYIIPDQGVGEDDYQIWSRSFFQMINEPFLFGVSSWKFTINELPDALKESTSILLGKQTQGVYYFENTVPTHFSDLFQEEKELLVELIVSQKIDKCCEEIHRLFHKAYTLETPLEAMQIYAVYFFLYIFDQINFHYSLCAENYFKAIWKEFLNSITYEELEEKLCSSIQQLSHSLLNFSCKSSEYINKALLYISKMYNQNISPEDIARLIGISPFYLSRLLKQEINKTFVEILTDVRISAALKLLKDPNKTIREIGEKVGYTNTNVIKITMG